MSLSPCSACGVRAPGKLAQITWAWWRADNKRVAYRQRLCLTCMATTVVPLEVNSRDLSANCPACGIDTSEDMDPVYATSFVPGIGKVRLELPTCGVCAVRIRERAMTGAVKLEDSGFGGQDPSPQTDLSTEAWAQLGIQPR